jgi:REP element-mobilizing transposase RayT
MDSDRIFFVTTVTANRQPIFRRDATARLLIETLARYRDERKFLLHEFVIMPDHVHALLTPAPDISLERTVQFIKGGFSYRLGRVRRCGRRVSRIIVCGISRIMSIIVSTSG